jgi:lipopolysaccharide export system protein LptA
VRFTIERLRTVVLAAGALVVIALAVSLALGTWKNPFKKSDIPKRLGIEIQQEANGVTYKHTFGSHNVFQIHASKVVQLKNGHALLHDVKIELYEADGSRVDRIEGNEFEYDQQADIATAAGPVEITMMRPGAAPLAGATEPPATQPAAGPSAGSAPHSSADEIHVKTSGLVFYQKTGVATTDQRADFSLTQGNGSAIGATYDSQQGHLVLDHQVELHVRRNGETVEVNAQHGEFERGDMICNLRAATAFYRHGEATAGEAKILFREDGSAVRLDATGGFALATATGGHLSAPQGWLEFNEDNQPRHGHLEGGVTMDSVSHSAKADHQSHGSSPTAELEFTEDGELRHAHLERGVELTSQEQSENQAGQLTVNRKWRSPVADVEFRDAGSNQVEPAWLHGVDGVVISGESRRGTAPPLPSRLAADDVTVDFGSKSSLSDLKGIGHAAIEQTTSAGARQASTGDRLEAHFAPAVAGGATAVAGSPGGDGQGKTASAAAQIEAATLQGHVVMNQEPAGKPGAPTAAPMHATAGRADYEGAGEWIHLTESPRVDNGGLQLTAEKIDVSQTSGDAFAHGDVKATWLDSGAGKSSPRGQAAGSAAGRGNAGEGSAALGGQGPSHVVAAEAQMHQASGEATFRGNARLWQDTNSVAAPVIVLNRLRQTLVASTADSADPVRVAMVTASADRPGNEAAKPDKAGPHTLSVIRVAGGMLKYSDAERKALMVAGPTGSVVTETATARSVSDELELDLLPPGNHAGRDGGAAQVDKMTASGHVVVSSQGRRGTGSQLVYMGETGEYVLTGTAAAPPRMTDPARGIVTGEALIFHGRDDSVSIEGGAGKTITETRTPK